MACYSAASLPVARRSQADGLEPSLRSYAWASLAPCSIGKPAAPESRTREAAVCYLPQKAARIQNPFSAVCALLQLRLIALVCYKRRYAFTRVVSLQSCSKGFDQSEVTKAARPANWCVYRKPKPGHSALITEGDSVEHGFIPSCRSAARSLSRALHQCGDLLCVLGNSSRRQPGS